MREFDEETECVEIPNFNIQHPEKLQNPNSKAEVWGNVDDSSAALVFTWAEREG